MTKFEPDSLIYEKHDYTDTDNGCSKIFNSVAEWLVVDRLRVSQVIRETSSDGEIEPADWSRFLV